MRQLTSSSSDLIIDSLSALYTLSRHPIIGKEILSNEAYMQQVLFKLLITMFLKLFNRLLT